MNSICIFCGSSLGSDPIFQQIAQLTGEAIAKQGKTLVYGGGRSGLMGVVADSALQAGGQWTSHWRHSSCFSRSRVSSSRADKTICRREYA